MIKQGKLELTWVGKYEEKIIEPRILVEDKEKSYGDRETGNMLIHGDNLIALKALEQKFSGTVKCIYIDPPYNTGTRIDADGKGIGYEDGLEHSIWLEMMHKRLEIMHSLLAEEGAICIHLDDNELDYCKVMMDEIFKRENFVNRITIEARSPSAFSTVNPGVFKASEYILWYAKDKTKWISKSARISRERDKAYNKYIRNRELEIEKWEFMPLKLAFLEHWNEDRKDLIKAFIKEIFEKYKSANKKEIIQILKSEFSLSILVKATQVGGYIFNKLKLDDYDEFYQFLYPYLLEKCTYFYTEKDIDNFVFENSFAVCRDTEISDSGAGKDTVDLKYESKREPSKIFVLNREAPLDDVYIFNGKQISFYDKNVEKVDDKYTATKLLTNVWTDVSWEGIAKEGGVVFKKGKKPEYLIKRIIELNTEEGDYVLDSFLGSGTTAAVAAKMNRKWIGIELGDHCYSHSYERIKKVVDGSDNSGISKLFGWQGGGGFKFYELAESLLLKNTKLPIYSINPSYTFDMVAEAICKIEGFDYGPSGKFQGKSSENRYIHVTQEFVNGKYVFSLMTEIGEKQSLLIYCTKSQSDISLPENVEIKHIPKDLMKKCTFESEVR